MKITKKTLGLHPSPVKRNKKTIGRQGLSTEVGSCCEYKYIAKLNTLYSDKRSSLLCQCIDDE
jgi:hypothetical protein